MRALRLRIAGLFVPRWIFDRKVTDAWRHRVGCWASEEEIREAERL